MLSLLRKRRSVRKFKDRSLSTREVDILIEALLCSPSSRNLRPWEFILVTDRDLLEQLGRAKEHGSAFLAGAALAVVVVADPEKCDVWIEDCSIASIVVQLTAESIGLGSCWAQIRCRPHGEGRSAEDFVKELLELPERYVVESAIGIGYPDEEKEPLPRESLQFGKIHYDRYGGKE